MTAGDRVGPYEILEAIGAGGMGEVWKARDTRLDRTVAIKFSQAQFSERFEREARAVAALNHPNICTLHDVGPNYLVMELVEGPTLAERIAEGPMQLDEALAVARQIADALEAAHEKSIVHRDLKPANIKIKPGGAVKVLDFGLAKMAEQAAAAGSPETSPTIAMDATRTGQILGTAAYMAPEQARGKTVDKRADIWAFGVVLYEMLAGRRLFAGDNISDTLVAVLKQEPQWDRVPAKARRLLQRCLEKDPRHRLRDIGDAWPLMEDTLQAPAGRSAVPWIAAGTFAALAAIALWAPWRAPRLDVRQPVTLDLDLGSAISSVVSTGPIVSIAPGGDRIVFVSQDRLFTRRLDQAKATLLEKTEGAHSPFFSPDGQWVGFFAGGKLKKARVDGGEPVTLCDAPAGRGASWAEDDTIVAVLDTNAGLSQVPAGGGKATSITELNTETRERTHRWPQVLPGAKAVLFTVNYVPSNYEEASIAVVSLVDRKRKFVLERVGSYPRYMPSGHLVYVTKGALFAVPFDPDRLEVRGPATPILTELISDPNYGSAQFDFSRNGTMLYQRGKATGQRTIQWLNDNGKTEPLLTEPAFYQMPRLSPDGGRLAFVLTEGSSSDVWVYDWRRGMRTRITAGSGVNTYPLWSPDSTYLVFASSSGISWRRTDGSDKPLPFINSKNDQFPTSFLPDGTRLAISDPSGSLIRTVPVRGSGQPEPGAPELFLKTTSGLQFPVFSPDGRWLAYASAESGTYEVYVRAFPDRGTQRQISNGGALMPVWSRNGRELFYRRWDQRIMVVNYTVNGETFVADKPRLWSERQLANTGATSNLDLAPDGKRFVVVMPADGPEPRESQSHVTLVVNFFDEVRRRVAAGAK